MFRAAFAKVAVATFASSTIFLSYFGRKIIRPPMPDNRKVLLIGTFYNEGWFRAHAKPLLEGNCVDEILVICDDPVSRIQGEVRFCCPSKRMQKVFGRMLSRIIMLTVVALRERPAIYMGYHIMPNGPLALVAASLFGGKSIYQMTGGPIQIMDGGYRSENRILKATNAPSKWRESQLYRLLKSFDAVVVRGQQALRYVSERQLSQRCFIVTGAVDVSEFNPKNGRKKYDVVCVSRLIESKGISEVLDVIGEIVSRGLDVRVVLVGGGVERHVFERQVLDLGIQDNVEFTGQVDHVAEYLADSRLFLLMSPNEGMSIAILEAMATGLPIVCLDVGDLRDAVHNEFNGYLLESTDSEKAADKVMRILMDDDLWSKFAENSLKQVIDCHSVEAVAAIWDRELPKLYCDTQDTQDIAAN